MKMSFCLFFSKIFAVAHCLLLLSSSVLSFFTFLGFFYIYICDLFLSLSVQIERIRYILSKNLGKLAFVKMGRGGGGMEIKFVLFYDMSAFWVRFVPLPLTSARWWPWTHAQWQQETWSRFDPTSLPEPSLWNEWNSWNLHLTSSRVPEFQLSQNFLSSLCSLLFLTGAGSWSDTQWLIWVQLLSVTRALWPSVRTAGIYSWCGWVQGPWQPKWSVCCLCAASSLCWLWLLQVSWTTRMVCTKHFSFTFL